MKKKYLPSLFKQDIWRSRSLLAENWFKTLKNNICKEFLQLENFTVKEITTKVDILKEKNGLKIIQKILVEEKVVF